MIKYTLQDIEVLDYRHSGMYLVNIYLLNNKKEVIKYNEIISEYGLKIIKRYLIFKDTKSLKYLLNTVIDPDNALNALFSDYS